MTEIEIFRWFKIACLEHGADDVPYLVGGAGPGGYRSIIGPPSKRPIGRGDILMLDTGAVFDGYHCDFDRNYAFGAGASCADIYAAMRAVLSPGRDGPAESGGWGTGCDGLTMVHEENLVVGDATARYLTRRAGDTNHCDQPVIPGEERHWPPHLLWRGKLSFIV